MKGTMSLIAGAHAAVAVASFGAVYAVSRTLDGMRRGGGFAAFSEGVVDASQWPLMAAWAAVAASLIALVMMRDAAPQERSMRTATLAVIAIASGIAGVFVFRDIAVFITEAMVPGTTGMLMLQRRLTAASAVTALCAAGAIAIAFTALRVRVARGVAVVAVVVSIGVSATMIVALSDLRARYGAVAEGKAGAVQALINR